MSSPHLGERVDAKRALAEFLRGNLPQFNFIYEAIDRLDYLKASYWSAPHTVREGIEMDAGMLPGYISLTSLGERWSTVLGWMKHLILFGSWENRRKCVRASALIMMGLSFSEIPRLSLETVPDNTHLHEILHRDRTIDLLILLMIAREHEPDCQDHINILFESGSHACLIVESFSRCPAEVMAGRLKLMKARSRRAVVSALIQRATERVCYKRSHPTATGLPSQIVVWELVSTIRNIRFLLQSIVDLSAQGLGTSIDRKSFLSTYAKGLHSLAVLAPEHTDTTEFCDLDLSWGALGECGDTMATYVTDHEKDPTRAIVELLADGFFLRTPWAAIYKRSPSHCKRRGYALKAVRLLLPFLYGSSIFDVVDVLCGQEPTPWRLAPSPILAQDHPFARVGRHWTTLLDWSRLTFRERSHRCVSICSNSEVRTGETPQKEGSITCRNAQGAESPFIAPPNVKSKTGQPIKQSACSCLETLKWQCPGSSVCVLPGHGLWGTAARKMPMRRQYPVVIIDYFVLGQEMMTIDVSPLHTRRSDPWPSAAFEPYRPRIQTWVSSIIENPTRLMLLEGRFRVSSRLGHYAGPGGGNSLEDPPNGGSPGNASPIENWAAGGLSPIPGRGVIPSRPGEIYQSLAGDFSLRSLGK
ncbi:hypothetical protein NMY22_g15647 [Coprinellus aureogranulatus]|nr:hypothetical protein NMY22_g15647 [Coprinellus aureogranulatus]